MASLSSSRSRSPQTRLSSELKGMKAFVINLDRRQDRWDRVSKMLRNETPWLEFERFPASDGRVTEISEQEVTKAWNTRIKACYVGCGEGHEWVFDTPGLEMHGKRWKWVTEVKEGDERWNLVLDDEEKHELGATLEDRNANDKFRLKYQMAEEYRAGMTISMSAGERGCSHSHLRLWKVAAERACPTLVLEDDLSFSFERADPKLGLCNGNVFTERLQLALRHAPADFDVIYLAWAGHRGGNFKVWGDQKEEGLAMEAKKYIRRAEYVWTTVAYVISQAGAKKLISRAKPLDMPADEFMATQSVQEHLKAYVALDECDEDDFWTGGFVDQFDFFGDSDIRKSDGGCQNDNISDFLFAGA